MRSMRSAKRWKAEELLRLELGLSLAMIIQWYVLVSVGYIVIHIIVIRVAMEQIRLGLGLLFLSNI